MIKTCKRRLPKGLGARHNLVVFTHRTLLDPATSTHPFPLCQPSWPEHVSKGYLLPCGLFTASESSLQPYLCLTGISSHHLSGHLAPHHKATLSLYSFVRALALLASTSPALAGPFDLDPLHQVWLLRVQSLSHPLGLSSLLCLSCGTSGPNLHPFLGCGLPGPQLCPCGLASPVLAPHGLWVLDTCLASPRLLSLSCHIQAPALL